MVKEWHIPQASLSFDKSICELSNLTSLGIQNDLAMEAVGMMTKWWGLQEGTTLGVLKRHQAR